MQNVLTAEMEQALFWRFYAGDLAARDELAVRHYKLAVKLAHQIAPHLPADELQSAGGAGLMQALETRRFDPARGVRFSAYLRPFVRGQVLAALRKRLVYDSVMTETIGVENESEVLQQIPDAAPTPAEQADLRLRRDLIEQLAQLHLSRLEREALLSRLRGETLRESARRRGVTAQAVQQALQRALRKVRAALAHPSS